MKLNMLELGIIHLGWVELGTIKNSVCALFLSHNFELCLIPIPALTLEETSDFPTLLGKFG